MIRSAVKIKNRENIQIFTAKISTLFILLQKWYKLVFPYLRSAKYPSYKTFPALFNQRYWGATNNVHYYKLYHKVDSFSNISETSTRNISAAQLLVSHDRYGTEKMFPMHHKW